MFPQVRKIIKKLSTRNYSKIGIIGAPFEKGQEREGVAFGPKAIREAGLIKKLEILGLDVLDYGDVKYEATNTSSINNLLNFGDVAACNKCLSEQVQKVIKDGRRVLTLGGDHSIGLGTVDGHVKAMKDVAVIWIDAHSDLNTSESSKTGNLHGMALALLTLELADYWPKLPDMDWQKPMLPIRNVAFIGIRDIDGFERSVIEKFGVTAFGAEAVERYGIHDVISMAIDRIDPDGTKSLHVSFDIDSLDPSEAPSTGTPVRGGLSLREVIHMMEEIYKTHRLNAIDVVEVNPCIGNERDVELTVQAAIHVIQAALGYSRRGFKALK